MTYYKTITMMSTKYTELSTSVDQLACFALNFCVLINSEEKFAVQGTISQYRQSLCNALRSSQMLCL